MRVLVSRIATWCSSAVFLSSKRRALSFCCRSASSPRPTYSATGALHLRASGASRGIGRWFDGRRALTYTVEVHDRIDDEDAERLGGQSLEAALQRVLQVVRRPAARGLDLCERLRLSVVGEAAAPREALS